MMGKQISSFIKNIRKISSETSEQPGGGKLLMTTKSPLMPKSTQEWLTEQAGGHSLADHSSACGLGVCSSVSHDAF